MDDTQPSECPDPYAEPDLRDLVERYTARLAALKALNAELDAL
jgi:hypothetical protein